MTQPDLSPTENMLTQAEKLANAGKNEALLTLLKEMAAEDAKLRQRNYDLELRIKKFKRLLFARKSERLRPSELAQLALALGCTEEEAHSGHPLVPQPEPPPEEPAESKAPKKKKKRRHPGRTRLSPDLEQIITEVSVPEEERMCTQCHSEMDVFGYVDHERIEHISARCMLHIERREKLGCKKCKGDAVTADRCQTQKGTPRAGPSLLAELVEKKCDDALPIHRQRDQLRRLGVDIPLNTLYGYFTYATSLLAPIAEATLSVVLGDPNYVAIDDTSLKVLDKRKKGNVYKSHLWCFTNSSPLVAYGWTETWSADEIIPWLSAIPPGTAIQCDDYKGYSSTVKLPDGEDRILVPPDRRLGCSMHVRRRFYQAMQLGDPRAQAAMNFWKQLYKLEARAKEEGLDAKARGAFRRTHSVPVLKAFEAWMKEPENADMPKAPLTKAIQYAQQQMPYIRACFMDGRFEIDNGQTERMIREIAIGRRNYLFTGSMEAGIRLAQAYTLVQSCRNLGFGSREYLIDVIDKLERGWEVSKIRELVPDQWAKLHRPS